MLMYLTKYCVFNYDNRNVIRSKHPLLHPKNKQTNNNNNSFYNNYNCSEH